MSGLSPAARALLPRSVDDFGTVSYWDSFYDNRGDEAFHWYVDGPRGADIIIAAVECCDSAGQLLVVNLGCGTCEVPKALAERWRKRGFGSKISHAGCFPAASMETTNARKQK